MTVASMMTFHSKVKDFIVFLPARRDLRDHLREKLMCLPDWYFNLFLEELKGSLNSSDNRFSIDFIFRNRKDLFSDDNGSCKMTGARLKFFTVNKEGSKVVRIEKVGTEQDADIAIRRRSYICKSCTSFKERLPQRSHLEMTPEERKATLSSLLKLCPGLAAFHSCKWFKFHTATQSTSVEADPQSSATASPLPARKDLETLKGSFTEQVVSSLSVKSAALLHSDAIRTGFQ